MKTFVTPQFGCCPLVSMSHNRGRNNKINYFYEKALRITYSDTHLHFKTC